MPTRANKSQRAPLKEAKKVIDKESDIAHSSNQESAEKECSCLCKNHQSAEDEWEIEKEELLHVEINGIFQVNVISKLVETSPFFKRGGQIMAHSGN